MCFEGRKDMKSSYKFYRIQNAIETGTRYFIPYACDWEEIRYGKIPLSHNKIGLFVGLATFATCLQEDFEFSQASKFNKHYKLEGREGFYV